MSTIKINTNTCLHCGQQGFIEMSEDEYNHMSHSQAMKEIKSKKWLWEDTCPCCDNNPCLESLDAQNNHGDNS